MAKKKTAKRRVGRIEVHGQVIPGFLASRLANYTTAQELFVSGGAPPLVRMPGEEYSAQEF